MGIKAYINFIELPTKIASVIPYILGIVYTIYKYDTINLKNVIIMFISMITFDMATTGINNYFDYKDELKYLKSEYKGKNPMFEYNISQKTASITVITLLVISIISGILLAIRTNLLLLIIGVMCFFIGIFYTFGPIPISRMPLGEVFSGFFMGLLIPFLTIYASIYDKGYFGIYLNKEMLFVELNLIHLISISIMTIPIIGGISNIMLANNICDLEEDIKINRFTLPYYIGKSNAIKLFKYIYYVGYISTILSILLGTLPKTSLLHMLSIIIVKKNLKIFENKQIKSKTFVVAVKNFTILGISYIITLALGLVFTI